MIHFPDWQKDKWEDYPENPIIGFYENAEAGFVIGNPQILVPGEFDSQWHALYHGFYEDFKPFYHHLISDDGIKWTLKYKMPFYTNPTFIYKNKDEWILYYSAIIEGEELKKYKCRNMIRARKTTDFINWSEPVDILVPSLDWECEHDGDDKFFTEARNPCVVKLAENHYRLYYSAGTVYLDICKYEEPKYISFADSESPFGPFIKHGSPIISPDKNIWYRNFGAGAIKVFGYGDEYIALYNSMYKDEAGYPHSAINVLRSHNGIKWEEAPYNPIIPPSGDGFKKHFVYQLDLVRWNGDLRLYYNGRNDWVNGIENIGLSTLRCDKTDVRKLWD